MSKKKPRPRSGGNQWHRFSQICSDAVCRMWARLPVISQRLCRGRRHLHPRHCHNTTIRDTAAVVTSASVALRTSEPLLVCQPEFLCCVAGFD